MSVRSAMKIALCLCFPLMVLTATHAARADNVYQPYYYQENPDELRFSHSTAPILQQQGGAPPSAPQQGQTPDAAATYDDNRYSYQSAPGSPMPMPPQPYHPIQLSDPPTMPMGTRSGLDGGIEGSYYRYNEPSPNVKLTGSEIGVLVSGTATFGNRMFDTLDFSYNFGNVDYRSPQGTSNDHTNDTWEIRDVIGRDFTVNDHLFLSPYVGLGYRNLYSDERGATNLGAAGYQRQSQYLYIPLGVKPQMRIDGADRVTFNVEYDYFVQGWQTSHLGDAGFGDPTVHNGQDTGLGFRGSAMWETNHWAFGPYVNYWNINNSSGNIFHSPNATCGGATCIATEPHNMTVEGGLQLKYHFFGL